MAVSMPRHDEPRAPVTEAEVAGASGTSRKPQSLREIAAALDLRHSGRRALVKLARKMKKRGEIHEYPNGRVGLAQGKAGRAIRAAAAKKRAATAGFGISPGIPLRIPRAGIAPGGEAGSESIDGAPGRASRRLRLRRARYAAKRFGRRSFHRARRNGRRDAWRSRPGEHRAPQALWRRARAAPRDASCA